MKHPFDTIMEAALEKLRKLEEQREEILQAFVAKHGFAPEETVQVIQRLADGSQKYWVEKRVPELSVELLEQAAQTIEELQRHVNLGKLAPNDVIIRLTAAAAKMRDRTIRCPKNDTLPPVPEFARAPLETLRQIAREKNAMPDFSMCKDFADDIKTAARMANDEKHDLLATRLLRYATASPMTTDWCPGCGRGWSWVDGNKHRMELEAAEKHLEIMRGNFEREQWCHAGCLTIAEGAVDVNEPMKSWSPAMKAVYALWKSKRPAIVIKVKRSVFDRIQSALRAFTKD